MKRTSADPIATAEASAKAVSKINASTLSAKPMARASKLQLLLSQFALRGLTHGANTAAVLPLRFDPETWNELMALQQAVAQRCLQQQKGWLEGFAAWVHEHSQLREANTLSKYVEQEYNLVAQFGALVADQMSQWAGLLENTQVDYGYWMAQQAQEAQPQAAGR
jgi:hypothetical protein